MVGGISIMRGRSAMIRKSLITGLLISTTLIPRAQPRTYAIAAEQSTLLAGVVTDTTGAVIPGAEITLIAAEKSIPATTADDGRFSIHAASGDYVLKVSSMGFRSYEQSIHLVSSTQGALHIVLQVSWGSGVNIAPETAPVPIENASLSSTIPLKPLPPLLLHRRTPKSIPLRPPF